MMDRRTLLKLITSGVGFTLVPSATLLAKTPGKRYAMVFDVRRCVLCHACTVNCSMENKTPVERPRTTVAATLVETHDGREAVAAFPLQCMHCGNPPCVKVCPVKATFKRPEDGIVAIDYDRCIHCNMCAVACPYGARKADETHRTPPEKCNFCVHRVTQGLLPSCVESCIGRARVFGDLNDAESEVARLVRHNKVYVLGQSWKTNPGIFYIGLPDIEDDEMLKLKAEEWQR